MTDVKWKFEGDKDVTYLVDTRLMMGTSKSPSVFHRLSQTVKGLMENRGYQVVAYLNDYIIVADDCIICLRGQHIVITLLRELGFSIVYNKVGGPTQKLIFLSIEIDTINRTISLPGRKVTELLQV